MTAFVATRRVEFRDTDAAGDAPLLAAIADGTFGTMKRPPDSGRGLDGVVRKADGFCNPALDLRNDAP